MNRSGIFINMPVVKIDSSRNNNDQSEKEKERQIERQLPRMRIAEKNRSEKILANAMQSGAAKKPVQEFTNVPRPATVKNQSKLDDFNQSARILDSLNYRPISKDDLNHNPISKDDLHHHPISKDDLHHHPISKDDLNQPKESKPAELRELHALEELLHHRHNPLPLSDMLAVLKNTDQYLKSDQVSEMKAQQDAADHDDMLCSLDFLGGYVSAFSEMPVIRAEIMEVIESLRQQVTSRCVDTGPNVILQQEGSVQSLGDSETQYSVQKDSLGNQRRVIELSESSMKRGVASPRRAEAQDAGSRQINKPGDDSLPLTVQRSV